MTVPSSAARLASLRGLYEMSWRRPLIASLSRQTSVRAEGGAACQDVSDASRCRGFHATGMHWSSPAPHMAVRAQASTVCCCAKPNSAKARAGRQPTWRAGADSLVAHRSILSVHSGHQLLGTPRRAQPAVLRNRLLHRRPRKCGVVATAERPATQVSARQLAPSIHVQGAFFLSLLLKPSHRPQHHAIAAVSGGVSCFQRGPHSTSRWAHLERYQHVVFEGGQLAVGPLLDANLLDGLQGWADSSCDHSGANTHKGASPATQATGWHPEAVRRMQAVIELVRLQEHSPP